jgi:uncharacterized SAM-binding protein YcdF (DUF218 family)
MAKKTIYERLCGLLFIGLAGCLAVVGFLDYQTATHYNREACLLLMLSSAVIALLGGVVIIAGSLCRSNESRLKEQ